MKSYLTLTLVALLICLSRAAPTDNKQLNKAAIYKLCRNDLEKMAKFDEVADTTSVKYAVPNADLKCVEEKLHVSLDVEVTEEDEEDFRENYQKYDADMLTVFMASMLCPPGINHAFKTAFINFTSEHHTGVLKEMNCKSACYQNHLKELDPESVLVADAQPDENCEECMQTTDKYINTKFYSVKLFPEVCQKSLFDMFRTNYYSVAIMNLGEVSDEVKKTIIERLNTNSLEVTKNALECIVNHGE
jgi:hypothetical protein